jgi:hypothetical protein
VGYFALGERDEWYIAHSPTQPVSFSRTYPHSALMLLYSTACKVEGWIVELPGESHADAF